MKYKGKILMELNPTKWDGNGRDMVVWNTNGKPNIKKVVGYVFYNRLEWIIEDSSTGVKTYWDHCAEIPTQTMMTWIQLEEWLAKGNGYYKDGKDAPDGPYHHTSITGLHPDLFDKEIDEIHNCYIQHWGETEWTRPLISIYEQDVLSKKK